MDPSAFPRRFALSRRFSLGAPSRFTVSPDGRRVVFTRTRDGLDPLGELWLYEDGRERLLASPRAAGGEIPEAERIRRERARERSGGIVSYATDRDVRLVVHTADGALHAVRTSGGAPFPLLAAGPAVDPRPSPDGRHVAYVTDGALRVMSLDGVERLCLAPEAPTPARTASGAPVVPWERGDTRRLRIGEHLTPDGLQVAEVLGTDGERVLFTAWDGPFERHVWSYGPEGGLVRLSRGPGVHTAAMGGPTVVLDSQTPDGHTVTVLHDGEPVGAIRSLVADPLVVPRPEFLALGGRELPGTLFLPSWHEPGARKLPVLLFPYSGPGVRLAVRARTWAACVAQWFAEQGFAVLTVDGRGTPGRGPAWEKAVHGDQLTPVLEDQIDGLRAAAAHCPDLDLGRVGIRGWSFGGTLAAAAVLRHPEVFHAAVSGAAPSDQRLYDTHWKERFLGHPDEEPENYARSSTIHDAPLLRRPLLLVHGMADDNVAAAHTLRMSAALLAAGRPHSVLPLSGTTHLAGGDTAGQLLLFELDFLRNALNR
ncbi:S9 family peptidase [Streptomyces olivoreticuli]